MKIRFVVDIAEKDSVGDNVDIVAVKEMILKAIHEVWYVQDVEVE
jgi:hypothetical protein